MLIGVQHRRPRSCYFARNCSLGNALWISSAHLLKRSSDALLVYAGDGAQRQELEREAAALGVTRRVRFLGFLNQSQGPPVYTSADLMVLPSEYEPFGVVVNEASCCGCPVAASDHVGAARDLIVPVDSGLLYPCGDVRLLSTLLSELCRDPERLHELGRLARNRMNGWSPQDTVAGTVASRVYGCSSPPRMIF